MQCVWQGFLWKCSSIRSYENTHWRETLSMQPVWQGISTTTGLRNHLKTHTKEKPYQCSQCDKTFLTNNEVSSHLRIHTGEKPYHCNQCPKSFAQHFTLSILLRAHTGEKLYQCNICSKSLISLVLQYKR